MLAQLLSNVVFLWKKFLTDKDMAKIKVTQVKSNIKRPEDQKRTLAALGLHKIGQVVEHEDTATIMGMVNKIKHLVTVQNV